MADSIEPPPEEGPITNGQPDPTNGDLTTEQQLRVENEYLRRDLESASAQAENYQQRLDAATSELSAAREGRAAAEAVTGDLRAQLGAAQTSAQELRTELTSVQVGIERQVSDAVRSALDTAETTHKGAEAAWLADEASLTRQLNEAKAQLESRGVSGEVAPRHLASEFASVLAQLAEQPAASGSFAAAMTGLEVEARGVLHAPRAGETEPRFATVEAGAVDPSQLSTMRMTFKLVPRLEVPTEEG